MYIKLIEKYEKEIISDIERVVNIPSVRDLASKTKGAPFGLPIRDAMNQFLEIAEKLGFEVSDHDGYAVSAQLGSDDEHIGVLGHLDVVEANEEGWDTPPFTFTIKDNMMFGRGVNDDKGPVIGALYAAKFAYDQASNKKRSVRIIAGGAEETTWECMDYYFKHNDQPVYGFSPDGNFPIVNGEMGILQLSLQFNEDVKKIITSEPRVNYVCHKLTVNDKEYTGDVLLSRNPHRGSNAIDQYFDEQIVHQTSVEHFISNFLHHDYKGETLNLKTEHEHMLDLSVCMMSLNSNEMGYELCLDVRYPVNINKAEIISRFESLKSIYNFDMEIIRDMQPLYVSEDGPLIHVLKDAYREVMDETPEVLTKGGASYARVLEHGVAFGATFENENPRVHMANEQMPISSLKKAMEIYCVAIEKLLSVD